MSQAEAVVESGAASAPAPVWHGVTAGAASALASRIFTHPADTVKARLQMQSAVGGGKTIYHSTLSAFRTIATKEGLPGFYRGFGAMMVGLVPASAAYFGGCDAYESGKALIPAGHGMLGDMAVGVWAQLVAGVVYTPIDIVKERLQVQAMMGGSYRYEGAWQAAQALLSQRSVAGLMRGYWATNAVWLPWNAVYIACYEQSKRFAADKLSRSSSRLQPAAMQRDQAQTREGPAVTLPGWAIVSCAAGSATVAVIFTHPADVVKTRLQVLSATRQGADTTALHLARQLYRTQGVKGFGAGLAARILTIAPGNAITWLVFEQVKAWLVRRSSA